MSWWRRVLRRSSGDVGPQAPIRFNLEGWTRNRHASDAQEWTDALGNTLRLEVAEGPAPYLTAATDLPGLREWCRQSAGRRDGGIVSVDLVEVGDRRGLQSVEKFERLPAYDYEGTLVVPLRDGHCRFVVRASEHSATGVREAVITSHLVSLGEIDVKTLLAAGAPNGVMQIPGWFTDPYDSTYEGRTLHSLADDPRVDGLFPDHPLSRVRAALAQLRTTIELDDVDETESGPQPTFATPAGDGRTGREMSGLAVGMLLVQAGRFPDAQTVLAESLKCHGEGVNADPVRVAAEWQFLGFAHEGQAQLDAAEAAFGEAAVKYAASLGERHLRTAQAVNNRARMIIARKDADGAEPLFRFSLEVFESEESNTSDTAVALNGLGLVHIVREQYREAVACFERAVDIFDRVHGPDCADTAPTLRHLALAWKRLGELERMAEAWQRADDVEKASVDAPGRG
jgi:hypothetical protein